MPTDASDRARDVQVTVAPADAGRRLDLLLAGNIEGVSRAVIQRWIRDGLVAVDGRPVKASTPLTAGSKITVAIPASRPATVDAEELPLRVVYQDSEIVVVDKPAGMVVHPSAGHDRGTVVNALLFHVQGLSTVGGEMRPGIVHRLDKGTSGLMVVAKNDRAHRALSRQFHDRVVMKAYTALVWGRPTRGLVLDTPLGRDPRHRQKISSRAHRGRDAITTIVDVEPFGELSLVRLTIGTGRTHQIRVHLSEAGFPVVGDALYGGERSRVPSRLAAVNRLERPFLHAAHLEFQHPVDGRTMAFDAALPEDLTTLLSVLGHSANAPSRQSEES